MVDLVLRQYYSCTTKAKKLTQDPRGDFRGVDLKKDDTILLRFGAANQDGERFECPRSFDIDRKNSATHLAFGGGIHVCLGHQLAKLGILIGINVVMERLENFKLNADLPEPSYVYSLNFRPLKALPIQFRSRG